MFKYLRNYIRYRRFFGIYKKTIRENQAYLLQKYGLEYNFWYELYATVNFTDAPDELKRTMGNAFIAKELTKYVNQVLSDMDRLDLRELVKRVDTTRVDPNNYGIAFGFAPYSNRAMITTKLCIIGALTGLAAIILLICL
jgi:hypothetical protein